MSGITRLPLNGSPNNSLALITNPGKINYLAIDYKYNWIWVSGDDDCTINQFDIKFNLLKDNRIFKL